MSTRLLPLLLVFSCTLAACAPGGISSTGSSRSSASAASSVPTDRFSVVPREATVDGEAILVFNYPSVRAARVDAGKISRDGKSIGGRTLPWTGTPRFYRLDTILVAYVGTKPEVLAKLKAEYGEPFAGPEAMGNAASAAARSASASVH